MVRPRSLRITTTIGVILLALLGVIAISAGAACDDPGDPVPCKDIPTGGCPILDGVDPCAADPTCEAIYLCQPDQTWVLSRQCPPHEAGATSVQDATIDVEAADTGFNFDAAIDAPPGAYGGPDCEILQSPDCTLGFALSCAQATHGCCDCETVFICENGGWTTWGECTIDGLHQTQ